MDAVVHFLMYFAQHFSSVASVSLHAVRLRKPRDSVSVGNVLGKKTLFCRFRSWFLIGSSRPQEDRNGNIVLPKIGSSGTNHDNCTQQD